MKRTASAVWQGTGKEGKGNLTTESGALNGVEYSFAKRFENEPGTNPEELIAAALAGCFTMKLSFILTGAEIKPERLETNATYTMEKGEAGWSTKGIHLVVKGKVPGATERQFMDLVEKAMNECPIGKILNINISSEGTLVD